MKKRKKKIYKNIAAALSITLLLTAYSIPASAADDSTNIHKVESTQSAESVESDSDQIETTESVTEIPSSESKSDESTESENDVVSDNTENKISTVSENNSVSSNDSIENVQPAAITDNTQTDASLVGQSVGTVDMYRMYNPNSGEHFYTASRNEALHLKKIGWKYEGVGWVAPSKSNTPVYRLYNPNAGDHHYTLNEGEKNNLTSLGWKYEGIGWYSDDSKRVPIYRQYNPNAKSGAHNYTSNRGEVNYLIKIGWNDEKIGWYAVKAGRGGYAAEDLGAETSYNGIDFSSIYDYNYYLSHNRDLAFMRGDDNRLIKHFFEYGIIENRQAKEGVLPSSAEYQRIRNRVKAVNATPELRIANQYTSPSNYLLLVNKNSHRTYVFEGNGQKGNWKKIKEWPCGDGKPSTPTPEGVFAIYGRTYMFGSGSHEFYASFFHNSYYFHSVIYSPAAKAPNPIYLTDGRVGVGVSHGCVRLAAENAKWIYDNCPTGTTVVVTRW